MRRSTVAARNIFLSYRRNDTAGIAGRVHDRLKLILPEENIFLDVTGIIPGADFRRRIEEALACCDVVLVLVGKMWLGNGRILEERDLVRAEIAIALAKDLLIVPVLVDGASMPEPQSLPEDIRTFHFKQAIPLSHSTFDRDMAVLFEQVLGRPAGERRGELPRPLALTVSMALGMAAALATLLLVAVAHNEITGRALSTSIGAATTLILILASGIGGAVLGRYLFLRRRPVR